jgi:hypothetical protein
MRLSQVLNNVWRSIADTMLTNMLKGVEAHLMALAMHKATAEKDIFVDAKTTAATVWKEVAKIPVVGPVLGPIAGAATFAAMMALASFDQGGIMPETGLAQIHKNEMVLPPALSNFVQSAAANASYSSGNGSGTSNHYHAAPGESPDSVGRNAAAFQRMMRDGRLRFT